MSIQDTSAASAPQDSSAGRTGAIARNDAFALPILFAYVVHILPLLVLRVVAVAAWTRLTQRFDSRDVR